VDPFARDPLRTTTRVGPYVDAVIRRFAETPDGARNDALNKAAYRLGQALGAGQLDRANIEARLEAAALESGYVASDGWAETRGTIRSGIASGMTAPLPIPTDLPPSPAPVDPAPWEDVADGGAEPGRFDAEYLVRHQLNELPEPAQLIDGILTRHAYALLIGRDSTYKSFTALDWSLCLATGKDWQGKAAERWRVLYIAGEGAYGFPRRVDAWEYAWGVAVEPDWFTVRRSAVNLFRDGPALSELLDRITAGGYGLVVVDTLRRASGGADGNGTDMGVVVDNLERIKRAMTGGTVLVVAHTGKDDKDTRGFSGNEDDADIVWHAKVADARLTLENTKQKDQAEHPPMVLRAVPVLDSLIIQADDGIGTREHTDSETRILAALGGAFATTGASSTELVEVTGLPKSTYYLARGKLLTSGQIVDVGTKARPRYEIAHSNGVQRSDSASDLRDSNESNGVQIKGSSPVQSSSPIRLDDGQTPDGTS
jgi:hypothetical protein